MGNRPRHDHMTGPQDSHDHMTAGSHDPQDSTEIDALVVNDYDMPVMYMIRSCRAIADIYVVENEGTDGLNRGTAIITRINVPAEVRRHGYGRDLLRKITDDADEHGITLALQPSSSGEMTNEQLEEWYWRNGFDWLGHYMVRPPRNTRQMAGEY